MFLELKQFKDSTEPKTSQYWRLKSAAISKLADFLRQSRRSFNVLALDNVHQFLASYEFSLRLISFKENGFFNIIFCIKARN